MALSLVILAAGVGSRYGGLKQMDPVGPGGEFILDYSVYDAIRAGFDHVVFVIRRDLESDFHATIGRRLEPHVQVDYAFQELTDLPDGGTPPPSRSKPWGTGQAVLAAQPYICNPFAVINADDFYGRSGFEKLAAFLTATREEPLALAMAGFRLDHTLSEYGTVSRGVCRVDHRQRLVDVEEVTGIERRDSRIAAGMRIFEGNEPVSMNMWGFKPALFESLRGEFARFFAMHRDEPTAEFFLPDVVTTMIRQQTATVAVLPVDASWFGVTHPQDRALVAERLSRLIRAGTYPPALWT